MGESWHDRLNHAMEVRGVGGTELAKAIGIKPPSVTGWTSKETQMLDGLHAAKACRYLRINVTWLFFGELPSGLEGDDFPSVPHGADGLQIDRMAAAGGMGQGEELPEEDHVIERITLTHDWVQMRLGRVSNPSNLKVISAFGDSMTPTFNDGDLLLVDTGIAAVDIDGLYVLRANQRRYIKRVRQRLDGAFIVSSDNTLAGTPEELTGKFPIDVEGRVVWAWNGKKL